MDKLTMVFMVVVVCLGLFSIAVFIYDIIRQKRCKTNDCGSCDKVAPSKRTDEQNCESCPLAKQAAAAAAVVEEKTSLRQPLTADELDAQDACACEEPAKHEESEVVFSSAKSETLEERYAALDEQSKNYYDEIAQYAAAVDKSKCIKNARHEEYKVGKNRLVRILIKRGIVVCELILPNTDFKNYIEDNKLALKPAATVVKVTDEEKVKIVKNAVDIAVKGIAEEKERKKEQAKILRRERYLQTKEE